MIGKTKLRRRARKAERIRNGRSYFRSEKRCARVEARYWALRDALKGREPRRTLPRYGPC